MTSATPEPAPAAGSPIGLSADQLLQIRTAARRLQHEFDVPVRA